MLVTQACTADLFKSILLRLKYRDCAQKTQSRPSTMFSHLSNLSMEQERAGSTAGIRTYGDAFGRESNLLSSMNSRADENATPKEVCYGAVSEDAHKIANYKIEF